METGDLLAGRVALVTGAGRGIGRRHCLELASQGAIVVVNDVDVNLRGEAGRNSSLAEDVVAEIEQSGGTAVANGVSVTDFNGVRSLIGEIVARFGRLDAVVNNAGIVRDRMLTSLSEQDWDRVIDVHLNGTFNVCKHACEHWKRLAKAGEATSGRIVNTTSGTGLFGNVGQANYGAAKAAIANLTMITALEMGRYGVTVNAISPLAQTRMTESLPTMQQRTVSDGAWDPMDAGNSSPVVAWLVSKSSGWLSGAVLRIDGNTVQRVRPWEVDESVQYRAHGSERLDAGELDAGMRRAFKVLPRGTASSLVT